MSISEVEIEFLKYLSGYKCNAPLGNHWSLYFANPKYAINKFFSDGLIRYATPSETIESNFTVIQLKDLLKNYDEDLKGKKSDLVQRLLSVISDSDLAKITNNNKSYYATEIGQEIILAYKEKQKENKNNAWLRCADYLRSGNYDEAYQTMASYQSSRVFPSGMNIDWNEEKNKKAPCITRKIINLDYSDLDISSSARKEVAILIALMQMFGLNPYAIVPYVLKATNNIFPCSFVEAYQSSIGKDPSDINSNITIYIMTKYLSVHHKEVLANYKKQSDIIKGVRIISTPNSCDLCKSACKEYYFSESIEIPLLPLHPGCKCTYVAVTISWEELANRTRQTITTAKNKNAQSHIIGNRL